jgi:hypothetical protein
MFHQDGVGAQVRDGDGGFVLGGGHELDAPDEQGQHEDRDAGKARVEPDHSSILSVKARQPQREELGNRARV